MDIVEEELLRVLERGKRREEEKEHLSFFLILVVQKCK